MESLLGNSEGDQIPRDGFTLGNFYESWRGNLEFICSQSQKYE